MDFHMAAAAKYSTGEAHVRQAGPAHNWPVQEEDDEDFDTLSELPTVDDLEVAAAAAAAGMEELAESSSEAESDSEDATSSGEDSDSSMEEAPSDEETKEVGPGDEDMAEPREHERPAVSVVLAVTEEGRVEVALTPTTTLHAASDDDSEPFDDEELREMLERMDGDGEDAQAAAREAQAEAQAAAPQPLLDVEIADTDKLLSAGSIVSVIENMVVVQVERGTRLLEEGAVLCLADRTPVGRIEDVFGPVQEPLYMLRFPMREELCTALQPGAQLLSVERLNTYLQPEQVQAAAGPPEELSGDEFEFSDGEEGMQFLQQQQQQQPQQHMKQQQRPRPWKGATGGRPHGTGGGRGRGGRGRPGARDGGRGRSTGRPLSPPRFGSPPRGPPAGSFQPPFPANNQAFFGGPPFLPQGYSPQPNFQPSSYSQQQVQQFCAHPQQQQQQQGLGGGFGGVMPQQDAGMLRSGPYMSLPRPAPQQHGWQPPPGGSRQQFPGWQQ